MCVHHCQIARKRLSTDRVDGKMNIESKEIASSIKERRDYYR
jgi:hypothetical protein